ncbi:unnamed protein product [Parajaminaea phylloscopi]
MLAAVGLALLAAGSTLASASSGALSARQYQDPNSPLLVDSPACEYYRCIVSWKHGDTVNINWINAPKGTVNLVMMINDNNNVAYQIANVSSPSQPGYCDAGNGLGVVVAGKECGRFSFVVPTEWTTGRNYTVRAQLIGNESIESYTDVVQLHAADGNPEPSFALSTAVVSGAPTETQGKVQGSQTASVTAPISPGAPAPSSSSPSSPSSANASSSLLTARPSASGSKGASSAASSASASASAGAATNAAIVSKAAPASLVAGMACVGLVSLLLAHL